MQLLAPIASEREYRSINPQIQQHTFNAGDETRLTKIYLYTLNNFHRVITLKEIRRGYLYGAQCLLPVF
ncbi:hypothetical protein [Mucilaginibacter sp. NFX135]|uniref:hypothetical protein n=1 Tax=Mucilaginibacter sp. NFX135 TaxID=3402687 RepID=UPI003AFAC78B